MISGNWERCKHKYRGNSPNSKRDQELIFLVYGLGIKDAVDISPQSFLEPFYVMVNTIDTRRVQAIQFLIG